MSEKTLILKTAAAIDTLIAERDAARAERDRHLAQARELEEGLRTLIVERDALDALAVERNATVVKLSDDYAELEAERDDLKATVAAQRLAAVKAADTERDEIKGQLTAIRTTRKEAENEWQRGFDTACDAILTCVRARVALSERQDSGGET